MAIKPPLLIPRRPLSGTEIQSYHFAHSPLLTRRVEFVNTRIRGNLGDNAPWNGQNCPLFHCHKAQIAADISKLFQLGAKSWKVHKFMQQDELGNLNLRQAAARHLSRFENGNWGFFVVISSLSSSQSSQSLHLGPALLCSAHQIMIQPRFPTAFTLQSEYKEMDKTTISQIWKSTVLRWETASHSMVPFFTVGLCPSWKRWWLAGGRGDHMVSLPPFIDSQIFTLVLNSHPTMSRNTAAPSFIVDQMTVECSSYRFGHRAAINWQKRRLHCRQNSEISQFIW